MIGKPDMGIAETPKDEVVNKQRCEEAHNRAALRPLSMNLARNRGIGSAEEI